MPSEPIGRMYLRKNAPGDGQRPKIRLWTIPIPTEGSLAYPLYKHFNGVFENVDHGDAKKKELNSSADLTPVGRDRQALDYSFGTAMPNILKGERALARVSQEVSIKRSRLELPKGDPSRADYRKEIRELMRGMDEKSREAFRKKYQHDPEVLQAIVESKPEMSGISDAVHDRLKTEVRDSANAPLMEEIHYLERAIEITKSAIDEGRADIRAQAIAVDHGYSDVDRFEARAREAAALPDQPWIKVHNENGQEILRKFNWNEETKSGSWPIATPEEIQNGLIAKDHDEYMRLKTSAPFSALSGTGDEARKQRAALVNEIGAQGYLNRHQAA
jgi:hypothetical protein